MIWHRQSPAKLLVYSFRLLSAGVLSIGGAFIAVYALNGSIAVASAVYSTTSLLLIFLATVLWKRSLWAENCGFLQKKGLLLTESHRIDYEAVSAVEVKRNPIIAVFGASSIGIFSAGDIRKGGKNHLLVSKEDGKFLAQRLIASGRNHLHRYECSTSKIVLMALTSASFSNGLLLTVPLVSWVAKHIDSAIPYRLFSAFEAAGSAVLPNISPLLSALALIPVVSWLLHFVITLLNNAHFKLTLSDQAITVRRGIIVHRWVRFPLTAVSALETRRTLTNILSGTARTDALAAGFGRCMLLPASDRREASVELSSAFPHGGVCVTIPSEGAFLWCRWWFLFAFLSALLTLRCVLAAEEWRSVILLLGLPITGLLLWRATVGYFAGRNSAVRAFGDCVEISGVRGLSCVTLRVFRGSIAIARVTQSPFQRACGRCSLYVLPRGLKQGVRCRHLPYKKCLSLLRRLG